MQTAPVQSGDETVNKLENDVRRIALACSVLHMLAIWRCKALAATMGKRKKDITEHDHQIGYWVSGKKGVGKFEALTTFGLRLLKHVQAPRELPNDGGFLVEVSHRRRKNERRERSVQWVSNT